MTPIGHRLAPPRFLLFLALLLPGAAAGEALLGWREGLMAGFDLAAIGFILACAPLFGSAPGAMRAAAARNDANRLLLLVLTGIVSLAVLGAVAAELAGKTAPDRGSTALIVATLALAWAFSNLVYALHYAHLYYLAGDGGRDRGGLAFPEADEPDYWDFVYFAFTLGMTFQTSDVAIEDGRIRRVATFHGLAAFVFNLGIVAFSVNVLGGG